MSPTQPKKKASETFRSAKPLLMELVRPRRGKLALGFGLMLINISMSVVLPGAPKYLLDSIIGLKKYYLLTPLALIVLGATVIQAVTSFSLTQLLSKEGQRLIAELRRKVQEHVGRLPVAYYDANRSGALVSRIMSDVEGVRNLIGTGLVDFVGGILKAIVALVILLRVWKPRDAFALEGDCPMVAERPRRSPREILSAWMPYGILVAFVLAWGSELVKPWLSRLTFVVPWPYLHNAVLQQPPAVVHAGPYAARYTLNWLAAAGTACMLACVVSAIATRMRPRAFLKVIGGTSAQLAKPVLTVALVLALAFLMNYSGATATLGLAFATSGVAFPFFSAMLGWIGVFLTGSDTSANALFGGLQVVTATHLKLNPVLLAAANSSGGVMGKMISLQSIAVAVAATGLAQRDESRLFRFTLKHSLLLASIVGLIVLFYAYVMPGWMPAVK